MDTRSVPERIRAARRSSTPLIGVTTPDQPAMTDAIASAFSNGGNRPTPLLAWTCLDGLNPLNEAGREALMKVGGFSPDDASPVNAVEKLARLDARVMVIMSNVDTQLDDNPGLVQALQTARNKCKALTQTVVLMGPSLDLPAALGHDVLMLDDPLPDTDQLRGIVDNVVDAISRDLPDDFTVPDDARKAEAAMMVQGLSAFEAEQAISSVVIDKLALELPPLASYRDGLIENVRGLSVDRTTRTFEDVRGIGRARWFMERLCEGPGRPRVILRIDEIEKKLAGSGARETSGGSTGADELQVLLTSMEDFGWQGVLLYGHPGSGKTLLSQTTGPTFDVQTLELDVGATRSKWVGESEQYIRQAIRTVRAIGGEKVYVMATANELSTLPPELKRRFGDGVFFFDLPSQEERASLWSLYLASYAKMDGAKGESFNVNPTTLAAKTEGWTGAEIRNACSGAYRLCLPVTESMKEIIPVALADADSIERRREHADRRYRNAAAPGHYTKPSVATGRSFLGD